MILSGAAMIELSEASKLGFGCMRFEGREDDAIDIGAVERMVDRYIASGGNYFDTAWAYPNSEKTLGKALVSRYPRESFLLASKCIAWAHCSSAEDLERQLEESLSALGTDYLDVYLMHNLGGPRTAAFREYGAWEFMKRAKERGLVRHIGFSSHCGPEELEQLVAEYPDAEVVQLQVNYLDWDNPSYRERECVEIARAHNLPIVVMEPVKGGLLADPPQSVKDILDEEMPCDSYATAALRFSASVDGVLTVLSGMSTLDMVEDNCGAFEDFHALSDKELAVMDSVQKAIRGAEIVPCTGCNYCLKVCPEGIGISGSLTALNYYINFKDAAQAHNQLRVVVGFNMRKKFPTDCIRCGACEDACPQGISILDCFDRIVDEIVPCSSSLPVLIK